MMLATSIIIADMIVISASVWVNGFMVIYFCINILKVNQWHRIDDCTPLFPRYRTCIGYGVAAIANERKGKIAQTCFRFHNFSG